MTESLPSTVPAAEAGVVAENRTTAPSSPHHAADSERTIYSASAGEIFWKNLLAGLAHGLGTILIYLFFVSGILVLAWRFLFPLVAPYWQVFEQAVGSIQQMNSWLPAADGGGQAWQLSGQPVDGQAGSQPEMPAGTGQSASGGPSAGGSFQVTPQQLEQARQLLEQMQQPSP